MIDNNHVSQPLAGNVIRLARIAEREGYAVGSTSEPIVSALINGRADRLPEFYSDPFAAIKRGHAGGGDRWHTMLHVHGFNWRN